MSRGPVSRCDAATRNFRCSRTTNGLDAPPGLPRRPPPGAPRGCSAGSDAARRSRAGRRAHCTCARRAAGRRAAARDDPRAGTPIGRTPAIQASRPGSRGGCRRVSRRARSIGRIPAACPRDPCSTTATSARCCCSPGSRPRAISRPERRSRSRPRRPGWSAARTTVFPRTASSRSPFRSRASRARTRVGRSRSPRRARACPRRPARSRAGRSPRAAKPAARRSRSRRPPTSRSASCSSSRSSRARSSRPQHRRSSAPATAIV